MRVNYLLRNDFVSFRVFIFDRGTQKPQVKNVSSRTDDMRETKEKKG